MNFRVINLVFFPLNLKIRCNECGKNCYSIQTLRSHMKQHSGSMERFICDICKKVFLQKRALLQHMKDHNDGKFPNHYYKFITEHFDLSCDLCEKLFSAFYDARDHYKECHNNDHGYIKCCKMKFRKWCFVTDHIDFHMKPDIFK